MPTTVKVRTPGDYSLQASFHTVSFDEVEYAEGGVALTFEKFERPRAVFVIAGLPGYTTEWDAAAQKLLIYNTSLAYDEEAVDAPGVEVADETDLSGFTDVSLLVLGI